MKVNLARRREVMERSMRLGHCICEPRRPCPCDVFRQDGYCPCAGERPDPPDPTELKLTRLVRNAGCASKIAPADLEAVLTRLPVVQDPAVVCGLAAADDAAIYRLSDQLHLVQTVDVFTPCVDDPRQFGRICAANCLSDVYAMGGEPRTALSLLAFPSETLPGEVMYEMLAGAMETLGEAGVALVGGHSLKDDEIKLGFAITGLIDPAVAQALDQPGAGDRLVLTKPLGTGVLAFAQQIGRPHPVGLAEAARSMALLNRGAADAMREAGATGCTDVTGFGLFGHLLRMLRPHPLRARVWSDALPAFTGVLEALRQDVLSGALERNREFVGPRLEVEPEVDPARVHLGFDAQTSGGLLITIPAERLDLLLRGLQARGCSGFVIGEILGSTDSSRGRILLSSHPARVPASATEERLAPGHTGIPPSGPGPNTAASMETSASPPVPRPAGCCADVSGPAAGSATGPAHLAPARKAMGDLLRSVQAPGVLDAQTKELVLFSLVVLSRCAPCFAAHHQKALALGLTPAQLDEAAWCAIAMGGAPVKAFYEESLEALSRTGGAERA